MEVSIDPKMIGVLIFVVVFAALVMLLTFIPLKKTDEKEKDKNVL